MNLVPMLQSIVASHQQLVVGLVAGAVLSNPGTCAVLLFKGIILIPGVGPWIGRNPDKAKAWADGFDQAIDACVDKYAKEQQQPPAAK